MPAIAEITRPETPHQPTGDVYALSHSDEQYDMVPQRMWNLYNPRFFARGTATISMSWLYANESYTSWLSFSDPGQVPTASLGTVIYVARASLIYSCDVDTDLRFSTLLKGVTLLLPEPCVLRYELSTPITATRRPSHKRKKYPAIDEANRLRDLAGVDPNTLAEIFGVTRQAYHAWQTGVAPVARHRQHLLEVLGAIEEAVHRFGFSRAVGDWLLTPSEATGKKPIDYLRIREYDTFRGMLLRQRSRPEFAQPLPPGRRIEHELPTEHREAARRRLRPPTVIEDD